MSYHWDKTSNDDLSILARKLTDLAETPGWQQYIVLVGSTIDTQIKALLRQPSPHQTADDYALRMADRSGYIRGLQEAQLAPYEALRSAQNELARRQQAAELAEPE